MCINRDGQTNHCKEIIAREWFDYNHQKLCNTISIDIVQIFYEFLYELINFSERVSQF